MMTRTGVRMAVPAPVPPRRVPYPDFPLDDRLAIEEALRVAWERLPTRAAQQGSSLWTMSEVEITALLQELLNELMDESPSPAGKFSSGRFETLNRGGELRDHAGRSLEKRPDLVFRYSGPRWPGVYNRQYHGLFVECKVIEGPRPERRYGQDGICRFVRGEYAWAMPSAMMLAYVRNGATVPGCLEPHLAEAEYRDEYRVKEPPRTRESTRRGEAALVYVSAHERPEVKVEGASPGDIEIAHLWLQVA